MTHRTDSKTSDPIVKNNKLYDYLKFIAMVFLPALSTLYFTLAPIWTLPDADKVVGSIGAVDMFLGVLLHISNAQYNKRPIAGGPNTYDGAIVVTSKPTGGKSFMLNLNMDEAELEHLHEKDSILFRVDDQTAM
jgi:hypothetical protein